MKKLIILVFLIALIGCSSRHANESNGGYTVKGRILQSCNNPKPVPNLEIILEYRTHANHPGVPNFLSDVHTDQNGNFSLKYDYNVGNDIIIMTSDGGGYSYKDLLWGIPVNKNLNVGALYLDSNFFARVTIYPSRQTSVKDTLYYASYGFLNFTKYIIGPFTEAQIIDSIIGFGPPFYDINNRSLYKYNTPGKYSWKLGKNGKPQVFTLFPQYCKKWEEYKIEIR